jgi:hypothetical protein
MFHNFSSLAGRWAARSRARLVVLTAAAATTALSIAACSQALPTQLPELVAEVRKVLSDDEQKKAIEELMAKQETHQREAIRRIENRKAR